MTQDEFIDILFIDTGMYSGRRHWLKMEHGVTSVGDLSTAQKSTVIDRLKEIKAGVVAKEQERWKRGEDYE